MATLQGIVFCDAPYTQAKFHSKLSLFSKHSQFSLDSRIRQLQSFFGQKRFQPVFQVLFIPFNPGYVRFYHLDRLRQRLSTQTRSIIQLFDKTQELKKITRRKVYIYITEIQAIKFTAIGKLTSREQFSVVFTLMDHRNDVKMFKTLQ